MSRPAPRRPSRTTTPKPRKIAGRDLGATDDDAAATAPTAPKGAAAGGSDQDAGTTAAATPPQPPRKPPTAIGPDDPGPSRLAREGTTRALLVLVGLCVLLLVLQGVWFAVHHSRNDDAKVASDSTETERAPDDPIAVPSGRPVVLNEAAVQEGVEAAASAAQIMFARSWQTYDDGVDDAVGLMTDSFAEEYRATTDDVRAEFIKKKTQVEVRVVAQSVVRANETELEALIFLNQYVIRGEGKDAKTTYTPYRALLRMVHTDEGWLVDGLQTK